MFVELTSDFLGQKAGARIDVSEVDADALIKAQKARRVEGDPLSEAIQKAMAGAIEGITGSLQKSVDEALKEFDKASRKSRRNAVPAIFGDDGEGDPKQTFGAFLLAVANRDLKSLEEMGSIKVDWSDLEQKADMTTNIGSRGGFTVPTQFYDDIALRVEDMSVVRKHARVVNMTSRTVEIPTPNYVTAPSAGDTASLSGLVMRWTEEGTALNQTEPTLKQLEITNYELSGYSKLNNTLLEDSPALESWLRDLFARGISWYEDYAFLRGDGVKKPYGMLTWINKNSMTVTRSAASAVALVDLAKMYGKMLWGESTVGDIFWVIHQTVIEKLMTMTGGDQVLFQSPPDSIHQRPRWNIWGHDVEITEKLPSLNTVGDIMLLNGQHYIIGDRRQYEVAVSEHAGFTTNQTYFRVVSRVGGQPWLSDKMTLSDASSTLGSFVALAAG